MTQDRRGRSTVLHRAVERARLERAAARYVVPRLSGADPAASAFLGAKARADQAAGRLAAGDGPVAVASCEDPTLELLYWAPFVRRLAERHGIARSRLVGAVVSGADLEPELVLDLVTQYRSGGVAPAAMVAELALEPLAPPDAENVTLPESFVAADASVSRVAAALGETVVVLDGTVPESVALSRASAFVGALGHRAYRAVGFGVPTVAVVARGGWSSHVADLAVARRLAEATGASLSVVPLEVAS